MTSEYTTVGISTIGTKFAVTDFKGQDGLFPKIFENVLEAVAFAEANKKHEKSEIAMTSKVREALEAAKGSK